MITKDILDQYRPTIGIECHVQLRTKTKLFSGANNDAREAAPNTTVSPICFGLPGTLPVLNAEAVTLAIRAGIALNADIAAISSFDRKHYFYPDLPKGYQITQLERPTVGQGQIEVPMGDTSITVRITRAHLEEDAGKLTHPDGADYSLVDLNRAGTPLIEVVSEADMHSPAEAKAFAQELWLLMKSAGVTYGDLYHGNMRLDVNISVAKKGDTTLGTRAEVKNLNSFRSVEKAAEYEFKRQVELLYKGEKVVQETRGWHDVKQKTFSQRSKENAHDYRYFPDADLPPIHITPQQIQAVRAEVESALPGVIRGRLAAIGIRPAVTETLLLADAAANVGYVQTVLQVAQHSAEAAAFTANFLVNRDIKFREIQKQAASSVPGNGNAEPAPPEALTPAVATLPSPQQFIDTSAMVAANQLSSNNADSLLFTIRAEPLGTSAQYFAQNQGLLQQNDSAALDAIIDAVLVDPACQKAVADYKSGNQKVLGFLVGQAMKQSKGQANPAMVSRAVQAKLEAA